MQLMVADKENKRQLWIRQVLWRTVMAENLISTIILCIHLTVLRALSTSSTCTYTLHVFNDGPVTLDVPVTLSAYLECADEEEEYLYVFEDDYNRNITIPGHQKAGASFVFTDNPGNKNIKVSAFLMYPKRIRVASKTVKVEVHEYIPGKLAFSGLVTDKDGHHYVATGKDVNITVELSYPGEIIRNSEFSFSWTIGESRFTSSYPFLEHRFMEPGPQWIRASVVARIPSYDNSNIIRYKWGYFDAQIIVKNPFTNISISGNTYLQHGQLLNLDIQCSGSGPVDYCWKVLPPSENHTNLSCIIPVSVLECSFPIIYYFQESGDYVLAIYVDNLVSSKQRNIEIHIYDVSLRPQLSTVIIPVVCTVLVLLIVAGAIVAHVRRTKNYDIETADFDFMITDEAGTVVIETSWEYMHRTFLQLLRIPYIYYKAEIQKVNYGAIIPDR